MWTLASFLFDEVSEQEWNAQGLPGALATSAALTLKAPLAPVCLDPHEQAGDGMGWGDGGGVSPRGLASGQPLAAEGCELPDGDARCQPQVGPGSHDLPPRRRGHGHGGRGGMLLPLT